MQKLGHCAKLLRGVLFKKSLKSAFFDFVNQEKQVPRKLANVRLTVGRVLAQDRVPLCALPLRLTYSLHGIDTTGCYLGGALLHELTVEQR